MGGPVELALRELLRLYERDEAARIEVRALLNRCATFTWATGVPRCRAPHAFRRQLLPHPAQGGRARPRRPLVAPAQHNGP
ncbi:hypothetical protein [Streptomyces justiciae]|uniref:Uncharacterized protein n=1 Tax=Streptomyces justiciae TaxID=2780140 RepID=A0ABU3LWG1_9ACTN|nr:hypothetical protein [Streptomyces justiciae]MDT7843564.1 hypothetical protein [Streptomyces justiciae]